MIRNIVQVGDTVLREKCAPAFAPAFPPRTFIDKFFRFMV